MKSAVFKACLVVVLLSSMSVFGVIIQEDGPELQEIYLPDGSVDDGTGYHEYNPYGVQVEVRWDGHTGQGYINTQNLSGMYVIWEYEAPAAGEFEIRSRFALGSSGNRDGQILINGVDVGTLLMPGTGGWDQWALSNTLPITLNEGLNTIRMNGVATNGLANVDYIEIIPEPATACLLGLGAMLAAAKRKRA